MSVQENEKKFAELQLKGYELEKKKSALQGEIYTIMAEQQAIATEVNQMLVDASKAAMAIQNSGLAIPDMKTTFKKNLGSLK